MTKRRSRSEISNHIHIKTTHKHTKMRFKKNVYSVDFLCASQGEFSNECKMNLRPIAISSFTGCCSWSPINLQWPQPENVSNTLSNWMSFVFLFHTWYTFTTYHRFDQRSRTMLYAMRLKEYYRRSIPTMKMRSRFYDCTHSKFISTLLCWSSLSSTTVMKTGKVERIECEANVVNLNCWSAYNT